MKFLIALGVLLTHLITGGQMWPNPGPGRASSHVALPVTQVITGGSTSTLTASSTLYASPAPFSGSASSSTEADFQNIVLSGTISDLHVVLSGDVGAGGTSAIFTLKKNGTTDTAVTCTVTGGAGTESSCTNAASDTVAEGDYLTMKIVTSGAAAVLPTWTWKWVGTNGDESMLISRWQSQETTGTTCRSFSGYIANGNPSCGADTTRMIVPEGFTVTKLFARAAADIGADNAQRVLTVRKNGSSADTSLQVTLTGVAGTGISGSDTTGSLSLAAGDDLDLEVVPTNTPNTGIYAFTAALRSTSQRFMAGGCNNASGSQSVVNYARATGGQSWNATESNRSMPALGFTQTGISANLFAAPSSGKSWLVAFRDDTANVLTCTIADAALSCYSTGSTAIAADSLVNFASTPTGTPTVQQQYCFVYTGFGT